MTKKFPGGFITKSPTAPSSSAATGIWTLEQAAQYKQSSAWPSPPSVTIASGALWMWGNNSSGTLGQNNTVSASSPVQVGALTNWYLPNKISSHIVTANTSKNIWSWGRNNRGQLGQNIAFYTYRSSPVQIGSLATWTKAISAGSESSFAIKSDGTLWSWGRNQYGQLGQNDQVNRSSPVQVGALTNWAYVNGNADSIMAVKTDGTLWTWGLNNNGNLMLNDTVARSSPAQVGSLTTWSKEA